jgi:hypothetical protein
MSDTPFEGPWNPSDQLPDATVLLRNIIIYATIPETIAANNAITIKKLVDPGFTGSMLSIWWYMRFPME